MRHKTVILLATLAGLGLGAVLVWPRINFYMLTGHFTPIQKIEPLLNPVAVNKWSSDGLHLADGRTVQLPGVRLLPSESAALAEATKRGVELHADGRVWGLVRVHHWCGNDPVKLHVARVDLANMMMFLRIGEPIASIPEIDSFSATPGGTFTEMGWRIGEFMQFQAWKSVKNSEKQNAPK